MSDPLHVPSRRALSTRLQAALDISQAAAELTLDYFQQAELVVERKSDDSPVTVADRQAEQLMRGRIAAQFPQDGVVGEEFGEQPGDSGFTWILDPIDGTKSFISGVPLYSVLVGIVHGESSVVGVIRVPPLGECVYAARGQGAWWVRGSGTAQPARVSAAGSLSEGLFVTSQVDSFAERDAAQAYRRLEQAAYITRTWGDGYGYLLVATGRALAMVDPLMNVWDAAALQPVLQEAGGSFSDWQGRETVYGGDAVATNGRVRDEVLGVTRDFAPPG